MDRDSATRKLLSSIGSSTWRVPPSASAYLRSVSIWVRSMSPRSTAEIQLLSDVEPTRDLDLRLSRGLAQLTQLVSAHLA